MATDDEKIAECCRGFGADVIMTSVSCQNGKLHDFAVVVSFHDCLVASLFTCWHVLQNVGSERCCEALQKLGKHYDIVVNIQGDEPLIEPEIIDGVVMALQVVMKL